MNQIDTIPEGAIRIHLYSVENVLRPRGTMRKESIGAMLLEKFQSEVEYWTDPKYGDSVSKQEIMRLIERNAREELAHALRYLAAKVAGPPPSK